MIIIAPLLLLVLIFSQNLRMDSRNGEEFVDTTKASGDVLGDYIDGRWKDSRIRIYGLRMAVLYHKDDRFVANLNFDEQALWQESRSEQLHILVPPNNSLYYSQSSNLADLDQSIRDWLFLEDIESESKLELIPDGWHLWRCVRPSN